MDGGQIAGLTGDNEGEDVEQLFSKLSDICKLLKSKGEDVVVLTSKDKPVNNDTNDEFITTNVDMLTKFKQFCEGQHNNQPLSAVQIKDDKISIDVKPDVITIDHDTHTDEQLEEIEEINLNVPGGFEDTESYNGTIECDSTAIVDNSNNETVCDTIDTTEDNQQDADSSIEYVKKLCKKRGKGRSKCKESYDVENVPVTSVRKSARNINKRNMKIAAVQDEDVVPKKRKVNNKHVNSVSTVKKKESQSKVKLKVSKKSKNSTSKTSVKNEDNRTEDTGEIEDNNRYASKEDKGHDQKDLPCVIEQENIKVEKAVEHDIQCVFCETSFTHEEHLNIHLRKLPNCKKFLEGADTVYDIDHEKLKITYIDKETNKEVERSFNDILSDLCKWPFQCVVCKKLFNRKNNCKKHILTHADTRIVACNICGTHSKSRESGMRHRKDHEDNPYQCDVCDKQRYRTQEELEQHRGSCKRPGPRYTPEDLTCDVCGQVTKCRAALEIHKNTHLGVKLYSCDQCGKKMSSSSSLERHIIVMHQDETPYKCEVCEKAFKWKDTLKKHMKCHEEPKYKCEICGKTCVEAGNLKKHMMKHTQEKPFVCEICGKSYSRNALLENHRRLHTGEKPYKCKEKGCGKTFRLYSNLRQHVRYHSSDTPFVCDVCGKAFKQPGRMSHHRKGHFNESRWSCLYCPEKFSTLFKYKSHLAKEHPLKKAEIECMTRIKLHQCEICEKVYGEKEDLIRHMFIHKGLKPFKCQVCFKGFNDKSNLKKHVQAHSNERKFICVICQQAFSIKRNLRMHLKCVHGQHIPDEKNSIERTTFQYQKMKPNIIRLKTVVQRFGGQKADQQIDPNQLNIQDTDKIPDVVQFQSVNAGELSINDQQLVTKETHVVVHQETSTNNLVLTPTQLQILKAADYGEQNDMQKIGQTTTDQVETIAAPYQLPQPQTLVPIPMMAVEVVQQPCFVFKK